MPANKRLASIRKIFGSAIFFFNIIAIIFLFLSAYSDRISPEKTVIFSFLGMGFPFILIINLFFLVWWLIVWNWKRLLTCILSLLLCYGAINAYFPFHFRTKDIPENCIKVLTYNVMAFEHCLPHTEKKPNPIVQFIKDSGADIVCIQEHRVQKNKQHLTEEMLDNALKNYPYHRFITTENKETGWGIFGLSVYSKFPIKSAQRIPIDSRYNGAFVAEIDVNGKMLTLINCHLETNNLSGEDRKEYYEFTKEFDSKKIDAVAEKTIKKLKPAFKARAVQANVVREVIRQNTNPYIIVCGDFNDTPVSYARRTIKGDLKDAYAETGRGPGITYNRNRFYFRIDYIFHNENIRAYNCTVGDSKESDHYPVWTWLELK